MRLLEVGLELNLDFLKDESFYLILGFLSLKFLIFIIEKKIILR